MNDTLHNLVVLEIANNHMGDVQHGIDLISEYSKQIYRHYTAVL